MLKRKPAPAPVTAAPNARQALCVLVVEDDEADAYLIKRALARNPSVARVVVASDGAAAFRMVEAGDVEPDLAFIDLHMPRKDGFDLLTELAAGGGPAFPMVVLTSSTAPIDAVKSRLRGAVRVVTKPEGDQAMAAELARAIASVQPLSRPPAPKEPDGGRFAPRARRALQFGRALSPSR